ncbi:hypothetical protein Ancab_006260 [Ancistrocladus abbreviatus]
MFRVFQPPMAALTTISLFCPIGPYVDPAPITTVVWHGSGNFTLSTLSWTQSGRFGNCVYVTEIMSLLQGCLHCNAIPSWIFRDMPFIHSLSAWFLASTLMLGLPLSYLVLLTMHSFGSCNDKLVILAGLWTMYYHTEFTCCTAAPSLFRAILALSSVGLLVIR